MSENETTEAERSAIEHVVEMAEQAYRADAIHEWFDEEGDGLRAALDALYRIRAAR
jgi:hypothetical protein